MKIWQKLARLDLFKWLTIVECDWSLQASSTESLVLNWNLATKWPIDRKVNRPWPSLEQLSRSQICQKSQISSNYPQSEISNNASLSDCGPERFWTVPADFLESDINSRIKQNHSNWSIGSLVHWSIGPLVHWFIGPLVHWSMSKIKCQMSIRLNFCRSVPPEFLRSFFLFFGQSNVKRVGSTV